MNKKKTIPVRDFKILYTIMFLNDWNYFPNIKGLGKIINGVLDDETRELVTCPTFGSITTLTSRKLTFDVHRLVNDGYLVEELHKESGLKILLITKEGKAAVNDFNKQRNISFGKRKTKIVKTIIKL